MTKAKRTMLLMVAALLCFGASAQERIGETIEVSIVNVEVHVTDKQGNRVKGLMPEDFQIRENGNIQTITNFSEHLSAGSEGRTSIEGPAEAAQAAAAPVGRVRRSIVLYLEPLTLVNFRAKEFFGSIRDLLHRTVEKGDQVSIVTFLRALQIRQPFTDDMASVDATLAALEKEMTGVEGNQWDESKFMLAESAAFEEEFDQALATMGFGTTSLSSGPTMSEISAARRERFLIRQKAAAIESLIQSISGADGRKVVIMATRRFGLYAGAQYFGGTVPPAYKQELDTTEYRQSLIRTANANGVTIYPVHPEGLMTTYHNDPSVTGAGLMETSIEQELSRSGRDGNVLLNESASLHEVAVATGGITAWGSKNIANLLPRVAEDLESYYSLGYKATATGKDAARKITVTTKNPDYVVRARKEFVEKSETTQLKDRVRANLFQRVESSSAKVPFDVVLGKVRKTGRNRWVVPLKIRIPVGNLTTLPEGSGESGAFSVYFATGGALGIMSDVETRTQKFDIAQKDLERAKSSHFTYELEVEVDQLVKMLSIAVMDDVGKEFGLKRFTLPKT